MQLEQNDSNAQSPRDIAIIAQLSKLDAEGQLHKYCSKTGKPCGNLYNAGLDDVIRIHGIERLNSILPQLQMTIAPEWIFTDSNGLQSLAQYQPCEYLVYAIFNLLPAKQSQTIQEQQKDFAHRIKVWENLQPYPMELITTTAELCRRLLAKNRPACLTAMLLPLSPTSITSTFEAMSEFIATMQACLVKLKTGYYEKTAIDARNKAMEQYRLQRQLSFLTDLEIAIGQEFDDFDLFDSHSAEFIEATTKRQAKLADLQIKQANQRKRDKIKRDGNAYTTKVVSNPKFTGLNFGGTK